MGSAFVLEPSAFGADSRYSVVVIVKERVWEKQAAVLG